MKKKGLFLILCFLVCIITMLPAGAASSKPAVELMSIKMSMNSVGGVSASFYYRNNSGRTIKYIDWYVSPYNRVGDKVYDDITGNSSARLRVVGPIEPFSLSIDTTQTKNETRDEGTPFSEWGTTGYWINNGSQRESVYLDKYNNLFVMPLFSFGDVNDNVYLTEDEINNAMYCDGVDFDIFFYNSTIDSLRVTKAVVTYMDDSKQTITGQNAVSKYYNAPLQNEPFLPTVARYSAVYNYNDYKTLNPDLIAALGDNEKLLFEHFINNGMKEGRQGSTEFNLAAYKANNPDLVAAFGDDNVKYYEHYISSGKAEGRKAV